MLLVSFLYAWRQRVLVCRRDAHTCVHISGGQRRKSRVFLYHSPLYSLNGSLSMNPRFTILARIVGWPARSQYLSVCPLTLGLQTCKAKLVCIWLLVISLHYGAPVFTASKLIRWTISPALFFLLNNYPPPPPAWFAFLIILELCNKLMPKQKRSVSVLPRKKIIFSNFEEKILKDLINACWNGGYLLARGAWDTLPLYGIGDLVCLINSCFVWNYGVYQFYLHHNFMNGNWVY